jgi:Type II secretion system (T2SS), protein K
MKAIPADRTVFQSAKRAVIRFTQIAVFGSALMMLAIATFGQESLAHVVFLEPVGRVDTKRAEVRESMPLYRQATNEERYANWLKNESAERALRLYQQALKVNSASNAAMDYYVALVAGGNHAAVGFRLQTGGKTNELPKQPYILLDPDEAQFDTTLLHESGHMVMALLAGGRQLDGEEMASIPHSTAALSDRSTAFSEGWAIHLETLAAHIARAPKLRRYYHRETINFGEGPWKSAEYFRHSADLTSYSQNLARYDDVRENNFAFESACQAPDYLRVQLEKARDFSNLRDANQLLQSEGFYGSFFFLFVMRGDGFPDESDLAVRYERILKAMAAMFTSVKSVDAKPWLVHFVIEYMKLFPAEKTAIVDVLDDLSHGVFVDPDARRLWREHYLGALQIDRKRMSIEAITAARRRWREQILEKPEILYSRVGPEIACTVPVRTIKIEVFGEAAPLLFDLNTAPAGILRSIPGVTEVEVTRWMAEREREPFRNVKDFRERVQLASQVASSLKFEGKV